MDSIKYFLYFTLCFFGIIWLFNFAKLNQLEDRYDKALKEHNKLLNQIEKDSIMIDSLETILDPSRVGEQPEDGDTIKFEGIYWPGRGIIKDYGDTISLLNAIIFVESCNNDSAYRASEDAVGCLQIRKCMVDDVNRILKRQKSTLKFTYNSRWSRDSSIQMFKIYCDHYNLVTAEEIARCWNGGPRGINNPATVRYWEKVKDKINS
tara:strand:+ start:221 stop:841 length:621 start_codon:yes stop_codon:yes gene_type:complete